MEAGLLAVAAAAVLIVCLRNAVCNWRCRALLLVLPVSAVLFQSTVTTGGLVNASLILGWAAVVVGTPLRVALW